MKPTIKNLCAPIETADGLREAIVDVIEDETDGSFTGKWLQVRLPYGHRVRRILGEFIACGWLERTGYGIYRVR